MLLATDADIFVGCVLFTLFLIPALVVIFYSIGLVQFTYKSLTSWKLQATKQSRFQPKLFYILRHGGWFPGRTVPAPESLQWHHPAVAAAAEFGGLTFGMPWRTYPDFFRENGYVSIHKAPTYDDAMRHSGICEIGVLFTDAYSIELYMDLDGVVYFPGEYRDKEYSLDPKAYHLDRALKYLLLDAEPTIEDLIGTKGIWIRDAVSPDSTTATTITTGDVQIVKEIFS